MALVIALALMTGLQQELQTRILGSNPHIFVFKRGGIDDYHAASLGVAVGDSVSVLTSEGTLTPGGIAPRRRRLQVAGTFTLGFYEFDSTYGLVSLDVAKRMLDKDRVDMIQLRVADVYQAA